MVQGLKRGKGTRKESNMDVEEILHCVPPSMPNKSPGSNTQKDPVNKPDHQLKGKTPDNNKFSLFLYSLFPTRSSWQCGGKLLPAHSRGI